MYTEKCKMFSCNCAVFNKKENKFIKKQVAEGLLSNLELKTLLSKILVLEDIYFSLGLILVIGKNYFDLDVIIRIFRLLLKTFIIIIHLHKKAKKESVIILNKKYEQYKR